MAILQASFKTMNFEKIRLTEIDKHLILKLLNDPLVRRHMPLSKESSEEEQEQYGDFIAAKEAVWARLGFGPWAYLIDKQFAGWAGIQPDGEDFELALVLFPAYWGYGKLIYQDLIHEAFFTHNLDSVTVLLHPSRTRFKGLFKAGFVEEGSVVIEGESFIRFRLTKQKSFI